MPPRPPHPGDIYAHDNYCSKNSQPHRKYLLILAINHDQDIIYRLLTSQAQNRPEDPTCNHEYPYASFHMGIIGGPLSVTSWVDIRECDDYDNLCFRDDQSSNLLRFITAISNQLLCEILDCVAHHHDTVTGRQRVAMLDQKDRLLAAR